MSNAKTAAAMAAAAALRAKLVSSGKLAPTPTTPATTAEGVPIPGAPEEDLTVEIEINDNMNRAILTRGQKQDELCKAYEVTVTTRGRYYNAVEKQTRKPTSEKPLHLYIAGKHKEGLEACKKAVELILQGGIKPTFQAQKFTKQHFLREKVYVDFDVDQFSTFNLRTKLAGVGNAFLGHIRNETGCKVILKGRGSGTIEQASGRESHESIHLHIEHQERGPLMAAKKLCEDLVQTVRNDYNAFCEEERNRQPPPGQYPGYGAPTPYGQQQQHPPQQQQPPFWGGGGGGGIAHPPYSQYGQQQYAPPPHSQYGGYPPQPPQPPHPPHPPHPPQQGQGWGGGYVAPHPTPPPSMPVYAPTHTPNYNTGPPLPPPPGIPATKPQDIAYPPVPDLPPPSKRKFSEKKSYAEMPPPPPEPTAAPPCPPPPQVPQPGAPPPPQPNNTNNTSDDDGRDTKKARIALVDYGDEE